MTMYRTNWGKNHVFLYMVVGLSIVAVLLLAVHYFQIERVFNNLHHTFLQTTRTQEQRLPFVSFPDNNYTSSISSNSSSSSIEEESVIVSTRVIASLVSDKPDDIQNLCVGLQSLHNLPDSNRSDRADVIIFHEGFSDEIKNSINKCIQDRKLIFSLIDYPFNESSGFPKGFDPEAEQPNWQKRSKWGYQQMIRFWITKIWEQPIIDNYETVMRLDSDSCFYKPSLGYRKNSQYLPGLPLSLKTATHANETKLPVVYYTNIVRDDLLLVSEGFGVFVRQYVRKNNLTVKNRNLFQKIPAKNNKRSPGFKNNFEVSSVAFMRDHQVKKFHEALTEHEPFGVFRTRWGDAIERYATLAIFATDDMIVVEKPDGYQHGPTNCFERYQNTSK